MLTGFQTASPVPQRMHRTRSGSVNSDRYASLVNEIMSNKPGLSPQQLGTMGKSNQTSQIRQFCGRLVSSEKSFFFDRWMSLVRLSGYKHPSAPMLIINRHNPIRTFEVRPARLAAAPVDWALLCIYF